MTFYPPSALRQQYLNVQGEAFVLDLVLDGKVENALKICEDCEDVLRVQRPHKLISHLAGKMTAYLGRHRQRISQMPGRLLQQCTNLINGITMSE